MDEEKEKEKNTAHDISFTDSYHRIATGQCDVSDAFFYRITEKAGRKYDPYGPTYRAEPTGSSGNRNGGTLGLCIQRRRLAFAETVVVSGRTADGYTDVSGIG